MTVADAGAALGKRARSRITAVVLVSALALVAAVGFGRRIDHPWRLGRLSEPRRVFLAAVFRSSDEAPADLRQWGEPISDTKYHFHDLPQQSRACNELLDLPRIALLFLARERIFHEDTWADWFRGVQGLVPRSAVRAKGCSMEAVRKACAVPSDAPALEQQFLFNVYTHPKPSFRGYPETSIFRGHVIPATERLETDWHSSNMTDAAVIMMRHALRDPHAQYFAVLSDSGVPLYPPTTVYLQLMAETRSRINACAEGTGTGRPPRHWEFQEGLTEVPGLTRATWRKSMQPVGLRRPHAEVIANDTTVIASFRRHCKSGMVGGRWNQCKVDELYMPTLLAIMGRDAETDCKGYLVTSSWVRKGRHSGGPHEWDTWEINSTLFTSLRKDVDWGERADDWMCQSKVAIDLAEREFVPASAVAAAGACEDRFGGSYAVLTQDCPLFARKFPVETPDIVHRTLINKTNGLRIIPYS